MPMCEMCGKEEEVLFKAVIEGVSLKVCSECAGSGTIIGKYEDYTEPAVKKSKQPLQEPEMPAYNIMKDFAAKIKTGREKTGLTQEEFSKKIAEKVSVIQHLESGKLIPSLKLARKLEQFLHVQLIEKYEGKAEKKEEKGQKGAALTIGDLLNLKEKTNINK